MRDLNWPRIYAVERGSEQVKTLFARSRTLIAQASSDLRMAFWLLQIGVHPRKSAAKSSAYNRVTVNDHVSAVANSNGWMDL